MDLTNRLSSHSITEGVDISFDNNKVELQTIITAAFEDAEAISVNVDTLNVNLDDTDALIQAGNDILTTQTPILNDIHNGVDTTKTSVDTVNSTIGTTNTKLDTVHLDITTTNSKLDTSKGVLDNIHTGIDTVNTSVGASNIKLDTITGYVDGLETLLVTTNSKLDTLDTRVDGVEGLITSTNSKIDTSNNYLTILSNHSQSSEGFTNTTSEHHHIHEGNTWGAGYLSTALNSGQTVETILITPSGSSVFHSFVTFYGTGEFEIETWEGVTTSNDGTPITVLNRNRNITNSPPIQFFHTPSGVNTTSATQLRFGRFGSGKSAIGDRREENEIVLKPNTKYYAKVTARTNSVYITHTVLGYMCTCGNNL